MAGKSGKKSRGPLFSDNELADFSNQSKLVDDERARQDRREDKAARDAFQGLQPQQPLQPAGESMMEHFHRAQGGSSIDSSNLEKLMKDPTAEQKRFAMDPRLRKVFFLLIVFIVVYIACVILPDHIVNTLANQNSLTLSETIQTNFELLAQQLSGQSAVGLEYSSIIIMFLIALTGAGLSSIGASYQVTFRNQLATPSSLGVMSGATVGFSIFYIVHSGEAAEIAARTAVTQDQANALATSTMADDLTYYLGLTEGAFYAMAGAFVVVFLTVAIAKIAGHGKLNNAALIIAGQVFASVANAFITLFRLYLESTGGLEGVSNFARAQLGDLSDIGRTLDLVFMGLPIIVCIIVLFLLAPQMNAIALGGEDARSYGLRVDVVRILVVVMSTIATAVIVAFVGSIGFVGFAMPQLVRRLVGPDFRYLLPASALAGASFLLIVNFVFSSFTFTTVGIGVVTSLIGGVVFISSIIQRRRVASNAE